MTLQFVFSCDGTFDDGKLACRAALPTRTTIESTAVMLAREAGWSIEWDRDLCASHVRLLEATE